MKMTKRLPALMLTALLCLESFAESGLRVLAQDVSEEAAAEYGSEEEAAAEDAVDEIPEEAIAVEDAAEDISGNALAGQEENAPKRSCGLITADPLKIGDKSYTLTAYAEYDRVVRYSGQKIKAGADLTAKVTSPSLDELAKELSGASEVSGLVRWKFVEKKNKKCGTDAYFTVKAVYDKTVAKSIGLRGKALTAFKKGLSRINKAARANRMYFTITTDPDTEETVDISAIKAVRINAKNFPDKNFRSILKGPGYDRDGNGTLDAEEIRLVINIDCEGKKVRSLKGVEYFVCLQGLWCKDNGIKSLDLRKNRDLRGLWCSGNPLTSLDLSGNPELVWVYCFDCKLKNLNVLNNPKLAFIECNTNPLAVLDVSRNPELEHLTCGSCELEKLDLGNNPRLAHLDAFRNHLTALDVSGCPKMKRLDIWDNPGLGSIDVSHNPELQYYNCANNDADSIDLSHNPELFKLICSYNDLGELDLSHNPKLSVLNCECCGLSSLDLSGHLMLYYLQAFTNDFTELDIGNNPFLIKTYLEGSQKDESQVGPVHSWTIDHGWDDSTGGDSIFFFCVDKAVSVDAQPKAVLPKQDPYPYSDPGAAEEGLVLREEALQRLYELAGSPEPSLKESSFTDADLSAPYGKALLWAEEEQICAGFPYVCSDTFGTGRWITRQDLALLLMRFAEKVPGYFRGIDFGRSDGYLDYFDIDYFHWEAVCWSAKWYIIDGKGEGERQYFDPYGRVNHAELETFIKHLVEAGL